MSIDFDSGALQTQQDEEEYDPEDYAREQELHKLLTDLPHDMLDDSRDSSSPEVEYSTCSNKNTGNSPQSSWNKQWSDHPRPTSHVQNYEVDYDPGSQNEFVYEDGAAYINGHQGLPQSQPLPNAWKQDHQFTQEQFKMCTQQSTEAGNFSPEFESESYSQTINNHVEHNGDGGFRDKQSHFRHGAGENQYKPSYNPHHPTSQPAVFNPQGAQQEGHFHHLQREFLDSTQQNAEREQLAQLQILNKAQQRQMEDLERKLEDARRNVRYLEHQLAIVKDEKEGLAVSLKESSRLMEEAKKRDVQMQNKLRSMEQQVQILTERNQENMKQQQVADAAVDSMKQQMLELCRSDTLSRAREQHDRDQQVMKEQHEAALLLLQQKLDSTSHTLNEQVDVAQKLREHVKLLERQREEEQLERAKVVNALSQRLEESQQQCAKLLQTNSVQEMSQMQIKLQQSQSAKELSDNMSKVLQEDLADLKEQITLYESAVKHGVIALDPNNDWDNPLSESCVDLGLKKANRKNGTIHSAALAHLSDSKLPKDEALRLLRVEMQRCLGSLKGKRQKISQLQEELHHSQAQVNKLQNDLDEAHLQFSARESSQTNHIDMAGDSPKDSLRLQEDKRRLQEQLESLERKNAELKSANSELCTKMRQMIKELDQEKQEAAERSERIHQQHRDDVVSRVRTELLLEHDAQIERLMAQHQQQVQLLQVQLSEVNDKMLGVQECYISICKEKDMLEESFRKREKEEAVTVDSGAAVEKLRTELEAQHQASVLQLKALWSKEKETEIQKQIESHVAAARGTWREEQQKVEKTWEERLEEERRKKHREATEVSSQTDLVEVSGPVLTEEELDSRLGAQRQQLQLEAEKVQRKAVEEARKQALRAVQEKHLEDMAKQVEAALTRAYNRWIEDLTSLPEYQAALQTEKRKWEEAQQKHTEQQVSQTLRETEEHSPGAEQVQELQEQLAALQSRLEQASREQAALMKAELAGARAAWNRDKQQEISMMQVHSEQLYRTKLEEQQKNLEKTVQQAREDAELQRKQLLQQMEAKFQQTVRSREEEWRGHYAQKELTQRQQTRDELVAQLQNGLAEVHKQLLGDSKTHPEGAVDTRRTSGAKSEDRITQIILTSCRDLVNRAVAQAKKEWQTISEETLSRALKESQELHQREMTKIQGSLSQRREPSLCRKDCAQTVSKLQKKNQELQRHLEKACRQLQHSVREHKTTVQQLKDDHESSLQKAKDEQLQLLEEVKRAKESSGSSDQQKLQQGLEEMKQQYLVAVEKIRGDMLRYLQESRERAAEMIRREVQRERQDTARKMRHYYLTCLQELLEDGGKITGAEKKIMNAASKLAAMAKVLETPIKSKSGKNYGSSSCVTTILNVGFPPGGNAACSRNLTEEKSHRDKTDSEQRQTTKTRTKLSGRHDIPGSGKAEESSTTAEMNPPTFLDHVSPHSSLPSRVDNVSLRSQSRELYLQGSDSSKAENRHDSERRRQLLLMQEAPVREGKPSDWSVSSGDSDFHAPRLSFPGRKVEPVKPFSASGEFGGLTPDVSDLTVYNEIAKETPRTETAAHSRRSREPTPGSEGSEQRGVCSGLVFSELRRHQQDSGFDSPLYQQK